MARHKSTVVLGLGNPLMTDEGIGCRIVEQLCHYTDRYPDVDFIDAGTGGMSVLHLISGRDKAILIDCSKMGQQPGTIRRFEPSDVESIKNLSHQSLHEMDILKVMEMADQLGQRPQTIVFFGIEPEAVEYGQILTETIEARMGEYISLVLKELGG